MRTAFEKVSESYINQKRIVTYFSKGRDRERQIKANVFFNQSLARGENVNDAKEQTEIMYPGIQVNLLELRPMKVGLSKFESWKVWFDYQEESA
ncbi:MAG: hypothetical protein HFJ58_06255 [Clostridia bacterium]|nr:hypothetical protein [Clostridia bacterium]